MAIQQAALIWASFSLLSVLYGMASAEPSIPMEYCASVNTADMVPLTSNYQSDGRCFGNCTDLKYALAIVQEKNCWCSNVIPNRADRKSLVDCQYPCPGYPPDYCGGDEAYGYMEVAGFTPTSTALPASVTEPASSSTKSSDNSSPTVETVTVGGTVRTVTATPKPASTSDANLVTTESKGLQSGAIAGIVVGVIGGLAVLAAFIWLWLAKRRKQRQLDDGDAASGGFGAPIRGGSGLSSPGMTSTPKTGELVQSRYPLGQVPPGWDAAKRRSHLMPVDPRLDPFAKGIYADQNRSRESFNSLQDNQDYSRRVHEPTRVLRATNPDPDD